MDLGLDSGEPESICKICGALATHYSFFDFNKNCLGLPDIPVSGINIRYHQCVSCGLIFTNAFDKWSVDDYVNHIYNDDYLIYDPEYTYARPRRSADLVSEFLVSEFITPRRDLRVLDYGGGIGTLASLLRAKGIQADTWDVLVDGESPPKRNAYDLVTAIEVFEHTPSPQRTIKEVLECLVPGGTILFSTLIADDRQPGDTDFWYIAPRNGHITIYTRASLKVLFEAFGYGVHHINPDLHMAQKLGD